MKIVIDKGHNRGQDQGAVAIGNENTMNIATGDKIIAKLKALGHEVLDTINNIGNDVSVGESLAARVNQANNWGADLYVSIHANCGGGHGTEVWTGSNSSRDIASKIVNNIAALGYTNRGVKVQGVDGGHLYVLQNTDMPALLVEQCFVDSQSDMNGWNPESMANAIVAGITGQTVQAPAPVQPKPVEVAKYEETVPTGPNIFPILNKFYIEARPDGDMGVHLDRGNYIIVRKGGAPVVVYNNNKGAGGSKVLF